jgi:guanine deaminase
MRPVIIRGGLVADPVSGVAAADILLRDGMIAAIGPHGMAAPEDAETIDAARRLIHPGLVNTHTHGHGNIARSMGDRWTLELLLAGGPHISGMQAAEEKHLSALIGAAEMVLEGCTACYDLFVEFPGPTREGMDAIARAYESVGMRAVIAPMLADLNLYQAVPDLRAAMPEALGARLDRRVPPPWAETLAVAREVMAGWSFDRRRLRPAVAPTIPHHCSDAFLTACRDLARDFDLGMHSHIAESKVQAIVAGATYGRSSVAHLDTLGMGLASQLVDLVFESIVAINRMGVSVLLVEQNAVMALEVAAHAYVLQSGKIAMTGSGRDLLESDAVRHAYLG